MSKKAQRVDNKIIIERRRMDILKKIKKEVKRNYINNVNSNNYSIINFSRYSY